MQLRFGSVFARRQSLIWGGGHLLESQCKAFRFIFVLAGVHSIDLTYSDTVMFKMETVNELGHVLYIQAASLACQ